VVECDLAKVEVAGSNPVSRSRIQVAPTPPSEGFLMLSRPAGVSSSSDGSPQASKIRACRRICYSNYAIGGHLPAAEILSRQRRI
jgi:hypothetical protein